MSTSKRTTHGEGFDGPDLTSSIMKRLGYAPITQKAARLIRKRKWMGRTAFITLALAAIIVGSKLQSQSPSARLPIGPTIPSAIEHDLTYHRSTIDQVIQTIKNLSPRLDVVPIMDVPKSVPIDDQPAPIQVGCISHRQFGWT